MQAQILSARGVNSLAKKNLGHAKEPSPRQSPRRSAAPGARRFFKLIPILAVAILATRLNPLRYRRIQFRSLRRFGSSAQRIWDSPPLSRGAGGRATADVAAPAGGSSLDL
jgi:hypothetical protein